MSMDRLHCEWMLSVLRVLKPRCVIEIGCHMGVSTTAIVQAYDEGCVDELHLIDVNLRPSVRAFARDRVTFHERLSVQALPEIHPSGDLVVVIDGDHSLACVQQELPLVVEKQPLAIIAHDVTAEAAGYEQCDGARWLWETLQALGWYCYVDCRRRPNAKTHRGLLVACRSALAGVAVRQAWASTCDL
jgi:hypothetical protein